MADIFERESPVEEICRVANDGSAPGGIVTTSSLLAIVFADRIGAVQRVVETAPARIGRVQSKAGIGDRHDQLRARDLGDLPVHVLGLDLERVSLGNEVTDLAQEADVFVVRPGLSLPREMPVVDRALDFHALVEQRAVEGCQVTDD